MNDYVFALDIGTQSVTGIILEKRDEKYAVVDYCIKQHEERSMLDGQIHNVVAVSTVIMEVKEQLEQSYGTLTHVCVAAAGRALKTVPARISKSISGQPMTHHEEIKHLELSAVQKAQVTLAQEDKTQSYAHYHCVGYSVLHYELDGEQIGSPIDQTGDNVSVEIIATFLPKVVIESLLAALDRANLTMDALTLEPIAAIHVLIPDSMRRLNVALIDIGAGTSDIAITSDGTVSAYGMVPVAGDKITEAVSDEYLLDFKVAEKTKRDIVSHGEASVHDILGFETKITYDQLVSSIDNAVDELAKLLTEEILVLNGKAPKAIMLIGGGSLTPQLGEKLGEFLHLPHNRIAIRDIQAIQNLHISETLPEGPDFVTPIGIAITAKQNPIHYINVTVNKKMVRMFEVNNLSVGDCLIQAGIELNQYYGRPGLASMITLNNEPITLPGTYGEKPTIYVNGVEKNVDTLVERGDDIIIEKGNDGANPHVTLKQLVGETPHTSFYFNGKPAKLTPTFFVNGKRVQNNYVIKDRDNVVVQMPKTVKDFIQMEKNENMLDMTPFFVFVNKQKVVFTDGQDHVFINDQPGKMNDSIKQNDQVTINARHKITVQMLLDRLKKPLNQTINITFNDKPLTLKQPQTIIKKDGKQLSIQDELSHLDKLTITDKKVEPFIFQDVFRYIDFDDTPTHGRYELYRNGEAATFFEVIQPGDSLELVWEKQVKNPLG